MANRPRVIEVAGESVGIVVPEGGGYRFAAVKFAAWSLEGETFRDVEEARLAAVRLLRKAPSGEWSPPATQQFGMDKAYRSGRLLNGR